MRMRNISAILSFLIISSTMFYYCGTTSIVEEPLEDITNPDIKISVDGSSDTTSDTIASDTSITDGVQLDTSEDTEGDTNITDITSDITGEDITEDIYQDSGIEDTGRDASNGDNEVTDTSTKLYSISGKVTVNGGNPEKNKEIFVFLFDQEPTSEIKPYSFTTTDTNNNYIFEDLPAGKYYVLAIYDIDGNGNPEPDQGDPIGYYAKNPVDLSTGSITGIDINIVTIQVAVASIYMRRQQQSNAYLVFLAAKVLNPMDGSPLSDATVTVTDGVSQQPFNLSYNPEKEQYEKEFNPYGLGAVIAFDGTYIFTVQHTAYGPQPVKVPINHKPLREPITIIQPPSNSTVQAGEDLVVEWKNPPVADTNLIIQVLFRRQNQVQEVFRDEKIPIPNPYTIDGSYLENPGTYIINVVSGRFRLEPNGTSIEATSGTVTINAQ